LCHQPLRLRRIEETLDTSAATSPTVPRQIPSRCRVRWAAHGPTSDIVAGQIKSLTLAPHYLPGQTAMFLSARSAFFAICRSPAHHDLALA